VCGHAEDQRDQRSKTVVERNIEIGKPSPRKLGAGALLVDDIDREREESPALQDHRAAVLDPGEKEEVRRASRAERRRVRVNRGCA
jgi:hypothetical protein